MMRFLGRHEPVPDAIVLEEAGLCSPDYCQDNDPLTGEIAFVDEVMIEEMACAMHDWHDALEASKARGKAVTDALWAINEKFGVNTARGGKTNNGKSNEIANKLASARQQALRDITEFERSEGVWNDSDLVEIDDPDSIRNYIAVKGQHLANIKSPYSNIGTLTIRDSGGMPPFEHPYEELFVRERIARGWLALVAIEQPDILRQMLELKTLEAQSDEVKRFVASEIGLGQRSIILRLFREGLAVDEETALSEYWQDYMARNNHSPQAQLSLKSMAVGACAMGAAECGMNRYGLCSQVIRNIRFEDLPGDLQTDISRKNQQAGGVTVGSLQAFADRPAYQISKWWRSTERIEFQNPEQTSPPGAGRRKRAKNPTSGVVATGKSVEASLAAKDPETESNLRHTNLSWKGTKEVTQFDATDEAQLSHILEDIMSSKDFAAYLTEHAGQAHLPEFVRSALRAIVGSASYNQIPAVQPIRYYKPYVDDAGLVMPIWRLSGQAFPGNAGKIGADMRIYFGLKGRGEERNLHILGIYNKAAVAKDKRTSGPVR